MMGFKNRLGVVSARAVRRPARPALPGRSSPGALRGLKSRRGVTWALMTTGLLALLGMAALAVSAGRLSLAKGLLQGCCDMAALAGAAKRTQCCDWISAMDTAAEYFRDCYFGGSPDAPDPELLDGGGGCGGEHQRTYRIGPVIVTITAGHGCGGDGSDGCCHHDANHFVQVLAHQDIPLPLAGIFGMQSASVRAVARAIAWRSGLPCIFVKEDRNCWGFTSNGSRIEIHGSVHSNCRVVMNGSRHHVYGVVEYRYGYTVNGWDNWATGGFVEGAVEDWPLDLTVDDLDPGVYDYEVSGDKILNGAGLTLPPGVWRIHGSLIFNGARHTADNCLLIVDGNVIFNGSRHSLKNTTIACRGRVTFNGAIQSITARVQNIAILADDDVTFNGSHQDCEGIIFSRGDIIFNGSSQRVYHGSLIGWTVTLNGSRYTIDATESSGAWHVALAR